MAFEKLEPFGDIRADLRSARICEVLAAINTPSGKRKAKLSDFLFDFEKEPQSLEEMMGQAEYANLAFDGQDLRLKDED